MPPSLTPVLLDHVAIESSQVAHVSRQHHLTPMSTLSPSVINPPAFHWQYLGDPCPPEHPASGLSLQTGLQTGPHKSHEGHVPRLPGLIHKYKPCEAGLHN